MRTFLLFFLFSITIAAKSQTTQPVPISEFIKEMMSANTLGRHTQVIMWFPTQYWKVAGDNAKANAAAIEMIQEWVKDYVIIAAADGQIMDGGVIHFKSKGEVAELITVVDSSGKIYKPIEEKDLSGDILSLNGVLKPLFNNLLGAFGEGINLFVFKLADNEGKNLIDAEKDGRFTVALNGMNNDFVLPLTSLLPPKYCPLDHAKMNATWHYCPFHGVKL